MNDDRLALVTITPGSPFVLERLQAVHAWQYQAGGHIKKLFVVISMLMGLAASTSLAIAQSFTNSSFETDACGANGETSCGTPTCVAQWTMGYPTVSSYGHRICNSNPDGYGPTPCGVQFVNLDGREVGVDDAYIEQTVSGFIPGTAYVLQFSMSSETTTPAQMDVQLTGATPTTQRFSGPPASSSSVRWDRWALKSMTFTPTTSSVTFRFQQVGTLPGGNGVGLDCIRIASCGPSALNFSFEDDACDVSGTTSCGTPTCVAQWTMGYPTVSSYGHRICNSNPDGYGPTPYGTQFVNLDGREVGQGDAYIEQTINGFIPGTAYVLQFCMSSETTTPAQMDVVLTGAIPSTQRFSGLPASSNSVRWDRWGLKKMIFTPTTSSVTFRFQQVGTLPGGNGVGLDGIGMNCACGPAAPNLSFEDDACDATGSTSCGTANCVAQWTMGYPTVSSYGHRICNSNPDGYGPTPDGNQFVNLDGREVGVGDAYIEQAVPGFIPGAPYLLQFCMSSETTTPAQMDVALTGATPATQRFSGPAASSNSVRWDKWGLKTMIFTPTTPSVTFRFQQVGTLPGGNGVGLDCIRFNCTTPVTGVSESGGSVAGLSLKAWPNPTNGHTRISFVLPAMGPASIQICDVMGRTVTRWTWDRLPAGEHQVEWNGRMEDGRAVLPGVFFYRLQANGAILSQKVTLLQSP